MTKKKKERKMSLREKEGVNNETLVSSSYSASAFFDNDCCTVRKV